MLLRKVIITMSFVYRIFGKVQDTVTRAVYGVEKQTSKMSFYSCVDKKINGDNITVRFKNRCKTKQLYPANESLFDLTRIFVFFKSCVYANCFVDGGIHR